MQTRRRDPELMDDPSLSTAEQLHARAGLARINACTGSAGLLWTPIKQLIDSQSLRNPKVLDIATGSGDVLLRLSRIAARHGMDLQADGCDVCDAALAQARSAAQCSGARAQFFKVNVLSDELPKDYDVVMTSLFMHHLSDEEAIALLAAMKKAAKRMVLVMDLVRAPANHFFVWLATRLLSTSKVVHFDGPASVRAAYTCNELQKLAQQAGLHGAVIQEAFPCRMMLVWRKDDAESSR